MELITTAEFAEIVKVPQSTARYWRHIGYGVHGFRVGRRVMYDRAAVERWLRELRDGRTGGSAA